MGMVQLANQVGRFLLRTRLGGPVRAVYHRAYRAYVSVWCGLTAAAEKLSGDGSEGSHLPPSYLRFRVGGTPSRKTFLQVGEQSARHLVEVLDARRPLSSCSTVLDFGCGCARTLRWLTQWFPQVQFYGTDADRVAVSWCRTHLPSIRFSENGPLPPLPFEPQSFDLIYGISVFTHLNQEFQLRWLEELRRMLKPDGILILSLHGETVWRQLDDESRHQVRQTGLLVKESRKLEGIFPHWYQTAYHTREYVQYTFGAYFQSVEYLPEGLGYHDLVLCRGVTAT